MIRRAKPLFEAQGVKRGGGGGGVQWNSDYVRCLLKHSKFRISIIRSSIILYFIFGRGAVSPHAPGSATIYKQ